MVVLYICRVLYSQFLNVISLGVILGSLEKEKGKKYS